MTPRVLDLFCGAGGASAGYAAAGFDVVGVDIAPQPNYPFEFHQADALSVDTYLLQPFSLVHASPPCQGYMKGSTATGDKYQRLIAATRGLLQDASIPYVIENIVPARPELRNPIQLCGEMFGLGTLRHRLFETSFPLSQPEHPRHRGYTRGWRHGVYRDGPYVAIYGKGGGKATEAEAADALGISWMTLAEMRESIPPAYTKYIGDYLMKDLEL